MLRKILIVLAVLLMLVVGAGVFLYYKIQPSIREAEAQDEVEKKILQPRLIKGEGNFERRAFYTAEGLGNISQISAGWPADREGADIAVVGSQGADFIDFAGQTKKQVRFSIEQHSPVVVARMSPSGEYGYLSRDESWAVPATLFDKEGHVSWRSEGTWSGVDDSVPGDLYGDGKLSVVIGFNGGGGIALFDEHGKRLWKKEAGNVWHVEMLDTNGDGREEILHSNARGQLLVRNANGDVIVQYLPGFSVSWFALTRWGEEMRPTHILVPTTEAQEGCCKPVFVVLDASGKTVAKLESPLGDLLKGSAATPIRFGRGAEYFAVLQNSFAKERSMLLLYDKAGQIAYQEILGESCHGMATLTIPDAETLLVGCNAKIWEYSRVFQTNSALKKSTTQTH
ncbi:MAG: hypothetical protein DMG44_02205 [Acidobacteria bacterium]|nr:MAG: hypothetical protein DMG44_02205 [Acidobacteriota bacterium]